MGHKSIGLIALALISGVAFLRVLVGYQPHSGQDNYHGLHAAYGGDFEAQRHWMELTWHLPLSVWYWYDLYYWGLDYPPLSAYLSWICGGLSSLLVGPESVALEESRGIEDPVHKSFMRATVLVTDLLFYGTVAWNFTEPLLITQKHTFHSAWSFVFVMIQPAILLIDHGHFQYNTTALGLSLWVFYFMTMSVTFGACVVGSVFFLLCAVVQTNDFVPCSSSFLLLAGTMFCDDVHQRPPVGSKFEVLQSKLCITLCYFGCHCNCLLCFDFVAFRRIWSLCYIVHSACTACRSSHNSLATWTI